MPSLVRLFHYTNFKLIFFKILVKENSYVFASMSEKWTQNCMSISKADKILNFKCQLGSFVIITLLYSCESPGLYLSTSSHLIALLHQICSLSILSFTSTVEEVVFNLHHCDGQELSWLFNVTSFLLLRSQSIIFYYRPVLSLAVDIPGLSP